MDRLIGQCFKLVTSPPVKAWLKEQFNQQLKSYETRVGELEGIVEKLKKKRDAIQRTINEERRHDREILVQVKEWVDRANELIDEYDDFKKDGTCHELAVFDLLKSGYLPKPGIRYRQCRKVDDITRRANELLQKAKFDSFSYWAGPPSMAAFFSNIGYESYTSREETMRKIIEELKKPSVGMIGLHGFSGMGKTTLVKEIANEALETNMFDVVTMASVTRNPDIRKIQGQIVDMLGVVLDEESDIARAARIHKILKNQKKSTLIILDDLQEKLDFNMLGIPYVIYNGDGLKNVKGKSPHVDGSTNVKEGKSLDTDASKNVKERKSLDPDGSKNVKEGKSLGADDLKNDKEETLSRYKGCKILMISESRDVLLSQMEGKAEYIFCLEALKDGEAERLFKKNAGVDDNDSKFVKLAAQIVKKCNGLPLSIVTTARALKQQSPSVWEELHRQLERQNLTGTPEFSTKLSYDRLEDEEHKYTFLLCAHMGHDALIMDLVKHCIGLGFLEGIYTVRETRDKVHALVAKLKESGLLSDSYSRDQFTMQDIVRRAALSIAYKENHLFTRTKGKIDEWPDKLERFAAISLHHCDFIEGFLKKRNYPRLRVFQVNNNGRKLEIPRNFFKGMKQLKVLILTGIRLCLSKLSISSLTELRMLCLEHCMLDKDLSMIGKLEKLRILSFSGSDIENLPVELKKLKKLQIFDISSCSKLKEIPSGVISSLESLEELYMRNTVIEWEVEEHTDQSGKASLSELKHLNQLTTLDIQIREISYLPKNLFFDKLHSYKIVIGDLTAYFETDFKMPEKYEAMRFLAIRLKNGFGIHSLKGIKMLFERVESLFLELSTVHEKHNTVHEEHNVVAHKEKNVVDDIFYRLNLNGFLHLKHLLIVNNSTIESLIHPKDRKQPEKAFPKLESLYLYNLEKMDKICSCELSEPSFGKLKVIKINLCGQLKNVFLISVVSLLTVLETIEVSECNSLKEIVPNETQSITDVIKLLKFPELRFLKLQSLYQLIGFYPSEKYKELFHEKVEVSKLERMELSSIPIAIIWSDHSSQRSNFQNLTHLDVNGCWELKYLLSFSMAKSLVSLQSLFVSECAKMTSIFPLEEDSHHKMEGSIFPKLKNMKLHSMKSLRKIWNSKPPSASFDKLDTLIIEECDKLDIVMEGIFQSLCNLRVTNCKSMQAIFNIREQVGDVANNLQDVHLETLPKLEHVWQLDRSGGQILKLNNLQKIWMQDCDSLKHIFPFAVAQCLHKLEYLMVCDCVELSEIVAKREAASNNDNLSFDFPKLRTIKFSELPRLTSFYPGSGAYDLSCPMLNDLSIELCGNLEPFSKEEPSNDAQRKLVLFPEKVINKLKSMQIESRHAKSPSSYMGGGKHRRDNLEELCLSRLMDTEILYSFLHRNPNLKSLSLKKCFFEEIVPPKEDTEIENMGVVPNLKILKLIDLPELKQIGFEPDIILERIEYLVLNNCHSMITVVPSLASLTYLTNLEVVNCDGLENIMSPSTARSLGQLNTMKVIKCESLMEIVGKEGQNSCKVVFKQLKALELVSLKNLTSFCSSDSCDFEFPSLEKLVVSACCNMEKFSGKVSTPILQNIYVVHEKVKKRCYGEGDLNATIHKIFKEKKFFEGMAEIKFSKHVELKEAWQGEVDLQNLHSWFYSLKILKLENCEIQPCAIPSNILPYLKSLKELQVRDCNNVEVIFDMNVTEGAGIGTTFQLQKLTLQRLPKLEHVWKRTGKETHGFQNLQVVFVGECHNLQTVFSAAVAKYLKKLDNLELEYCDGLQEIVGREEYATADVTQKFVFPCLTTLDLQYLKELIYFYSGSFTLECPLLNKLYVLNCPKLELFESANIQPFFSDLKDISNLEKLSLDWEHTLVLRSKLGEFGGCLENLNYIWLFLDVDVDENPILPIEILQKASNLKQMGIEDCHCLGVFRIQIPEIYENRILRQLKIFTLHSVSKLQSIGSEDSPWLNVICDKLHEFYVYDCPDLTKLVHSTSAVSFSYLKELFITGCEGLKYLFTSSAANKLMYLEHIEVWECESIKEIVAKDENETTSGEIKLERLYRIDLNILDSLECFYSGNHILQLPSLVQVDIWNCPNMKIFSKRLKSADSFRGIQASSDPNDELLLSNDVNSSVNEVFLQQGFFKAVDEEYFSENLFGKVGQQSKWLCNLATLKLSNCTLQHAIPSIILPCLKNLGELEILDSDKVEIIFDINDTEMMETTSQLKKMTLQQLSSLVHVWEKNSQGVLIFKNLQEVIVSDCENLQTLFPPSLAKNLQKLENLEIESCHKLQEIVEKEESTAADITEEFVFPCLEKLDLYDLPQLTCFYPHTFTLKCPSLSRLYVWDCHKLELFQNAHPMGESTSINRLPLISNLQVISKLKELKLDWKHIWALILRFRSEEFPEGLENLENIFLYFDADENEKAMLPIEILQKAPNLIEMTTSHCNAPEILFAQNPKIGEDRILGQLKILSIMKVSALQSIELADSSWLNTICKRLHKLDVSQCRDLTTLVHTMSFSCLKKVSVSNCPQLQYLLSSSAAKQLMNLEEMTVKECESMNEIVVKEGDATGEAIQFGRLKTIVLHGLPSLICFYSGSVTLHLSSLVDVHVWQCPDMKIFSHGVIDAECFRGIQMSLDPNEDLLFHHDLNATVKGMFQRQAFFQAVDKECFSDNLELQEDWCGKVGLHSKWLCNLVILKLGNCTLPYAIPSVILSCLKSLGELEVLDSDKVEVIFDMNDTEIMETTSQLKKLTLQQLSNLVHVWEKNSLVVLIFQSLQEVIVSGCENLQTLFPPSLAKNLQKLEKLEIESCHKLQEIVEKEESTAADVAEKFVFPCLKKLRLHNLPQVTCFYPQTFSLECPALTDFSVVECHKLDLFQSAHPMSEVEGTSINRQPLISNLKVISGLKKLKLDWKHIWTLTLRFRSEEFAEGLNYLDNISLYLDTDENEKAMLPIEILQKAPNLIEMTASACNVPGILLAQNPKIGEDGILGQLKILTLHKVSILQSIESEDSSWLNTICEKLHELNVDQCSHLTTLVHTVSFSCLKKVSVSNCPQLQYLLSSSAAKKLMNLEEMTVKECESMKEIVAKDGDATGEAIQFGRLNTIVLHGLPSLICFHSGSDTLLLSSLVDMHVWQCPDMKIFSHGVIDAECFRGIQMSLDPTEDLLFHHDLNATVKGMFQRQAFFQSVDEDCFSHNLELQEDWRGKVNQQNQWLCNLVTLKLDKCALQHAIPSIILPCLKNLEELEVLDSDTVEIIFDINDTEMMETASQLKKLTLQRLSSLVHVWGRNRHGVLIFKNLQDVIVSGCENLQTIFPPSLAKNLQKLEKLEIQSCHKLLEIVEKEESTAADITEEFVFPCLEKLDLYDLPQLTCFYPQTFTVEFLALNKLSALDCPKLELFQSAHGIGESTSIRREPLISNLKVISKLMELKLHWKHMSALSLRFWSEEFSERLSYLESTSLFFYADENEKPMLPIEILQKAPNLKEMSIEYCNSPEILLAQNPKIGEDGILGQLKKLTLFKVSALQSIESEVPSWLNTICEKLHELFVDQCSHLTTLVHTVSFSCLKKLWIYNCPQLQYLFTSSAAKKLMNLEEITVNECESMTEIVAKEGDATSEAIRFGRLNTIVLHCLPSLICFYSGSDTLCLSSLVDVHVWECPNMKIFCQRVIDPECFRGIQMSLDPNQDLLFHNDLNGTVNGIFQRQAFFQSVHRDCFSNNLELQQEWHGRVNLQNQWLCNLVTLKLDKCALQHAIPFIILLCLKNLEELKVLDSDRVEVVFDMNDTEILETASQLKKLTLQRLSSLVHVWGRNRHGVLIFKNLQEVIVSGCQNLQTLFPPSLAKNLQKLEKLEIKSCHKLLEIVEKEESTAANVTEKFVFPSLENLHLYDLPRLTYFYPQTFTVEFPALNKLSALDCPKLELFQSAHGMGESTSIRREPLISNIEVISKLKELRLDWKHISALTLKFRSEEFSEGLEHLENISLRFNRDKNEKAMFPIEILQKAPNLMELTTSHCNAPEILFAQNPIIGEDGILGLLKVLTLRKVFALQSIKLEDSSWLSTICEKLHELHVSECPHLTTLIHTVSFSCLKKLYISNCPKLQYLFTSSAAKMLMNLEEIRVNGCESIKEIVAKDSKEGGEDEHQDEGDDKYESEMVFGKLEFLKLYSLPKFESFYMGSSTLNFLSLKEVWFNRCYSTKLFRLRDNWPVKLKVAIDGFYMKGDIHSLIVQQLEEEAT